MRTPVAVRDVSDDAVHAVRPGEEELLVLAQVIRSVVKRHRLSHDDELDFGQHVHLRLLESGYRQFRQFAGRSSLRTYLHVVISRMFLDWTRSFHGKWRPSSVATELGPYGAALDRLMHRDGHTSDQAVQILEAERGAPSAEVLRKMAEALPARVRRQMVALESCHEVMRTAGDDPLEAAERRQHRYRVRQALKGAVRQLSADDRRLLELRFERAQQVATTAATLRLDAKALYRRYERLFESLRRTLERSGVARSDVTVTSGPMAQ